MIYVCFAYGMPGCLPNVQDYESYADIEDAWRGIHQRLSNWRDQEEEIYSQVENVSGPAYPPILYPMAPQQLRNWFDGTVTYEVHELGRSKLTGEEICVVLMSQEDWEREMEGDYLATEAEDQAPISTPKSGMTVDKYGTLQISMPSVDDLNWKGFLEFDRQPIDNVAEDERMNAIIAGSFNEQMLRPKPIDEYDMHEALDRVSMLATTWSSFVTEARAIQANRAWHQLAENIEDMMQQLYQMIGDKHL